jgi:hypothetical protein
MASAVAEKLTMSGLSALPALAIVVVAVGAQAEPTRSTCFVTRNISSFSAPNDRTVYVRVGVRDFYRLDLMGDCTGISFRNRLALKSAPGSSWICSPLDVTVINTQMGSNQRCPVTAITRLTPDEVAALPKRDRP